MLLLIGYALVTFVRFDAPLPVENHAQVALDCAGGGKREEPVPLYKVVPDPTRSEAR
jgi:hypothetical protein